MKHFIVVSGNIGSGKTTLAKKLAKHFNFEVYQEPFELNPYLEQFYKDMRQWAFHSQMAFLAHSLRDHLNICKNEVSTIQDRSLYENVEVFTRNLFQSQYINEEDWQTFSHLYENIKKNLPPPDLMIFVKASPAHCHKNVMKRGREMEKNLGLSYLVNLDELYNAWIESFSLCPVVMADADLNDFRDNEENFSNLAGQIESSLNL